MEASYPRGFQFFNNVAEWFEGGQRCSEVCHTRVWRCSEENVINRETRAQREGIRSWIGGWGWGTQGRACLQAQAPPGWTAVQRPPGCPKGPPSRSTPHVAVVHGNTAATPSVFSWWTFLPIPLLSILNFYILRAALKALRWIYKSNLRLPISFYVVSMVIFFFWYNWTLFYHFYCAIFQYFFPLFLFSFLVS